MIPSPSPITVEFAVSWEDLSRFCRGQVGRSWRSRLFDLLPVVLFLWIAGESYFKYESYGLAAFGVLMAAHHGIPGLRDRLFFHLLSWTCGCRDMRMRVNVDEEHITVETFAGNQERPHVNVLKWQSFIDAGSAQETADVFLLEYPTRRNRLPSRGALIPRNAFQSETDQERFRAMLQKKLGEPFQAGPG